MKTMIFKTEKDRQSWIQSLPVLDVGPKMRVQDLVHLALQQSDHPNKSRSEARRLIQQGAVTIWEKEKSQ